MVACGDAESVYGPGAVVHDAWETLRDLHMTCFRINHREAALYGNGDAYGSAEKALATIGARVMGADAWEAVHDRILQCGETFTSGEEMRLFAREFFVQRVADALYDFARGYGVPSVVAPWYVLGPDVSGPSEAAQAAWENWC
jgi:hypothetical protein